VLVAPHPLRSTGAFTWVLSHTARVHIDIYSLSGRRIRRLGPQESAAGFGSLAWDGTDADGRRLASGTYVYVLTAKAVDTADEVVRQHRGAVVLLPE
jgi:flagellar hook assembly protein FlgD